MKHMRLFNAVCLGLWSLSLLAPTANGQAKWLTQKTKPFTSGVPLAEVLEELGAAHKFEVEYADEDTKDRAARDGVVYANLEGIPLATTLQLLCSHGIGLPWSADKLTLTVQNRDQFMTVTHDVSRLGPCLRDPVEFRYAIMNSILDDWADPETPPNPDQGEILDLNASTMTVRQHPGIHMEIAELLDKLRAAAGGKSTPNSSDTRIIKAMEKNLTLPAGTTFLTQFLSETLPTNKIPYQIQDEESIKDLKTAEVKLDGEKHSLQEILEPIFAEREFQLQVRFGVLIAKPNEVDWPIEIYNIQRLLNTATGAEIAVRMTEVAGDGNIEYAEPLGPFMIVMADPEGHKKIATAMAGK